MDRSFYSRDPAAVAGDLLGSTLVHGDCRGRIVETEAYRGSDDPASHAANGRTGRNRPMFGPPGHAYVYVCYGIHDMLNATTGRAGTPGAVLVRGVRPASGIDRMRERRGVDAETSLCDGPGKLCQAFGVDRRHDGAPLDDGALRIAPGGRAESVRRTPRIGVSSGTEAELRFVVDGSDYVS